MKDLSGEGPRHPLLRAQRQAEDAGLLNVAVMPSLVTPKGVEVPGLTFSKVYVALAASEADEAARARQTAIIGAAIERIWNFAYRK